MAIQAITIGHTMELSLVFLDQNGNPMLDAQKPDSPPVWANTTPATDTEVVSADGLTNVVTAVAKGQDTISVTLSVGGVKFSASLDVDVQDVPQVLSSVAIAALVN